MKFNILKKIEKVKSMAPIRFPVMFSLRAGGKRDREYDLSANPWET